MEAQPTAGGGVTTLLLDCLGTLVRLDAPGDHLRTALEVRLGVDVGAQDAAAAMRAEIAFYRPRMHAARDAETLARLRRACAGVVRAALPALGDAPIELVQAALLDALRFEAFDDAAPALRRWRAAGLRLVVVSNWDASLPEVLEGTGLLRLVDGWVASAVVGAAKPDPLPVRRGLELAGARPQEAWLVGDTPEADVGAARAAGVVPVLVDRTGDGHVPDRTVRVVDSLSALPF
jgi:putative hydrolase of the HAD superfamily